MQINSNQEKVSNKNIKMRITILGSEKNMMRCWLFQSRQDYQAEQFIRKIIFSRKCFPRTDELTFW